MAAPAAREAKPTEPARRRGWRDNPWWIPPFLGSIPELEPPLLRALALVSLGLFFEAYDFSLLTAALKHIADDLRIEVGALGSYLAAIRCGGILAFAFVPFADRLGRRRVFLGSLVGMSVATLATAFVRSPAEFLACQLAARAFMLTASAVAFVMITEEFPAEHRGWGIGMASALAAFGYGLGALLFGFVESLPYGWRALYAIGALPLLLLPWFRRSVRETERFRAHRQRSAAHAGHALVEWLRPLAALASTFPGRAACVGLAGMLAALGSISVFQFTAYFALTVHEWRPWQYSTMVIAGGAFGVVGNVVAGRLGDRIGRRAVGLAAYAAYPFAAAGFYHGPSWGLPLCWALIVFAMSAGDVVVRALSTELFPTSHRGTSAGWLTLLQTLGWIVGLGIVGSGTAGVEDLVWMITALSAGVFAAGLLVLLLPETRQRELEALSEEA